MKFPISELDRQKYFEEIYKLLEDNECQIFIDTNIIALCYRIHDSARKEFFDWILTLITKERINTPIWALNEYTNRFIRNQLEDYLSPLKKISTINKDFREVSNFLKMNIDTSSLNGTIYTDLKKFQDDLQTVEDKLKSIAVAAKAKDEAYKLKIHNEIQIHFEKTIINSSIDDILTKINSHGGVRYNHKLPPGFQDGEKDLNVYGDLIIWHEIMNFCKTKGIKKTILITNDGKKDWVYAPNRIIENGRSVPNKSQLKIADPRLIYEFKLATDSEDFYIINFDLLVQILIQNAKGSFIEIANALQVEYNQNVNLEEEKIEEERDTETGIDDQLISKVDTKQEKSFTTDKKDQIEKITYSKSALADSEFPLFDESYSSEIILNLKNYNWYVQNPTINNFLASNINIIEKTDENRDKLFVIGRNLYQAACGAAASGVDFIKNIKTYFAKFNDFVAIHLYSGILYEIYFDSKNEFRNELKSTYITEVLKIKDLERLSSSLKFIDEKLKPHKGSLLYYPSKNDNVMLQIKLEEESYDVEDWLGLITTYKDLEILTADGIDLLTEDVENSLNIYYSQVNTKGLVHLISTSYAIPENQIEIVNKEIIEETAIINFGQKRLKKLNASNNF